MSIRFLILFLTLKKIQKDLLSFILIKWFSFCKSYNNVLIFFKMFFLFHKTYSNAILNLFYQLFLNINNHIESKIRIRNLIKTY